jgi:hypothetical protein
VSTLGKGLGLRGWMAVSLVLTCFDFLCLGVCMVKNKIPVLAALACDFVGDAKAAYHTCLLSLISALFADPCYRTQDGYFRRVGQVLVFNRLG